MSSRICVKNIGKNCNEQQLRDTFSKKGEVTDVKVLKKSKNGVSRNFAFIGFRTELQAQEAIKYFNNTFIGLSRISVEMARKLDDASLKEKREKFQQKNNSPSTSPKQLTNKKPAPAQKETPVQEKKPVIGKNKQAFLDVTKKTSSTMAEKSEALHPVVDEPEEPEEPVVKKSTNHSDNAQRALDTLHGSSFQGRVMYITAAKKLKEKEISVINVGKDGRPLSSFQQKKEEERRKLLHVKEGWNASYVRSDAVIDNLAERYNVAKSTLLDTELKGGDIAVRLAVAETQIIQENKAFFSSHGLDVKPSDKRITTLPTTFSLQELQKMQANKQPPKLIVRNVAFQASKEEIRNLFTSFGSVKRVRIPKKMDGTHRGFAFVEFSTTQEAINAMNALKNTHLYGRHLVIEWAKIGEDGEEDDEEMVQPRQSMKGASNAMAIPVIEGQANKGVEKLRKRAREDEKKMMIAAKKQKKKDDGEADDMNIEGEGTMKDLL
eukprot:gene7145-7716_t